MSRRVWIISALESPRVPRRCPRCDAPRRFVSSDRFRVNAQKRRLDVWLIYNCPDCDFTWNATIAERATPEDLGADLALYQDNDAPTAWRCAFGVAGADRAVPYRVARPADLGPLSLQLADPVSVRLDRLLAAELGLSRTEVSRRIATGRIAGDLRREVANGQRLLVEA